MLFVREIPPLMDVLRERGEQSSRREEAVERGRVPAHHKAFVETESAEAAKSVQMRQLGRRIFELDITE